MNIELEGFGERHPKGTALYLIVDDECTAVGSSREPGHFLKPGTKYQLVHVMSRWAGGEVRSYVNTEQSDGERFLAFVRQPAYPAEWPELDRLVGETLGVRVKSATVA